jgi:hypothetical protein
VGKAVGLVLSVVVGMVLASVVSFAVVKTRDPDKVVQSEQQQGSQAVPPNVFEYGDR